MTEILWSLVSASVDSLFCKINTFDPLDANPTKCSNILKEFNLPTNCLSVFDHFVGLVRVKNSSGLQPLTSWRLLLTLSRKKNVANLVNFRFHYHSSGLQPLTSWRLLLTLSRKKNVANLVNFRFHCHLVDKFFSNPVFFNLQNKI